MRNQFINDSLVFSQLAEEQEQNLLLDSTIITLGDERQLKRQNIEIATAKIQRNQMKSSKFNQNYEYLRKFMQNQEEKDANTKSFKKLQKDKEKFLNFDPKIQKIALRNTNKYEKVDELISLIESQRIIMQQNRLKGLANQLLDVADDLINQKKSLQKQLQNLIQLNKVMVAKFKQIYKHFEQSKNKQHLCSCKKVFSFSKKKSSPLNYWEKFQFAKTIINSFEELELKKVEEQQGTTMIEMPFVQLLWVLKNKAQGQSLNISEGLLDRVSSGPTLKSWISKIDQKLCIFPKVSDFSLKQNIQNDDNLLDQFLQLIKQSEETFINNIKNSKDPLRELQVLRHTTFSTFVQIVSNCWQIVPLDEAVANFGQLNRYLTVVQKKTGVDKAQIEETLTFKNVGQWLNKIYGSN